MGSKVQGGKAMASCPRDRRGGARSVQLLCPLPTGPCSAGTEELPQWWVATRKVSVGCVFRRGWCEPAQGGPCVVLPGSWAVTALGRGPAQPAGPQRGWLWRTTGADLRGRTQGLALRTPLTLSQSHET